MHYCQRCERPVPMVPDERGALCPRCGGIDPTARQRPLYVVTGASGAGKTTLLPLLLERLAGSVVVFDVDWLIDPLRRGSSDAQVDWESFRDTWLHVAHGVAQSGLATVLLGPFFPEQLDSLPGREWVTDIHYLVLDCPDDERRRRIEARPPWRARDVDEQITFGRWLRTNLPDVLDTSATTPADAADAVVAWISHLAT